MTGEIFLKKVSPVFLLLSIERYDILIFEKEVEA
jgi:hypothetical protein